MQLQFKPDFDTTAEHWRKFWDAPETLSRPTIIIEVPREPGREIPKPHQLIAWNDSPEAYADALEQWAESRLFLADMVPHVPVQFGPEHLALLVGAEMDWNPKSPDTVWTKPMVDDWSNFEIRFRPESKGWQNTVATIRCLRERFDGKLIVNRPVLSANLDLLAALRGAQELLLDLVMCPDQIDRALEQTDRALEEIVQALREELGTATWGSMARHQLYGDGMVGVPQSDFSCMIGQADFRRFVLPHLQNEARVWDHMIYHLDGPDAIRHLEDICSIDAIQLIQWQPGAGNYEKDWADLRQHIDQLGRGQLINCQPEEIADIWQNRYQSRQLVFYPQIQNRAEAENVLETWL